MFFLLKCCSVCLSMLLNVFLTYSQMGALLYFTFIIFCACWLKATYLSLNIFKEIVPKILSHTKMSIWPLLDTFFSPMDDLQPHLSIRIHANGYMKIQQMVGRFLLAARLYLKSAFYFSVKNKSKNKTKKKLCFLHLYNIWAIFARIKC